MELCDAVLTLYLYAYQLFCSLVPEVTSPVYTITRPNTQLGMTITKWPWDLVISYVTCMGEICLHGSKSRVKSDALVGCHGNEAGLLQFLKFQLEVEKGTKFYLKYCHCPKS